MTEQNRHHGPYRRAEPSAGDEHPIDLAVERRLPLERLRGRIKEATERLLDALDGQPDLWRRLEELLNEYRARREEAFFDIGHEHSVAAGRTEALRALAACPSTDTAAEAKDLADTIHGLALQAHLPQSLIMAAILETAWALALDLPGNPETRIHRRTRP